MQSVQRDRIRESAAELGEHLRCGQCVGSRLACLRGSSELCCCHMELSDSATAAAATAATSSMLGDHARRPFDECRLQRGAVHGAEYTSCRRTRTMGAREEHSHVARVSTGLFLSRSRLDRNHSCTHSTHVLAQVETVVWWTLATFLALASERAGLCGRKRVCQDRRWVPLCLGGVRTRASVWSDRGSILATVLLTIACPSVTTPGYVCSQHR